MQRCTALAVAGLLLFAASARADLAEIKKRGVLKVVAAKEEAPEMFSFAATGEPGFEREIVEGFARLQGLKIEAVPAPTSDERIGILNAGQGDIIIGIVANEARRKLVNFTTEVLPTRHLVVTVKPHRVVTTVDQFREEKVGVVKGTTWAQAAVEAGVPAASMETFPDRYSVFTALRAGKVTATVMSLSDYTLATRKNPDFQEGVFIGPPGMAGFAVRKDEPELLAALDQYLDNMRKGQSWNRLVIKYFGEQALSVLGRAKK